MAHTPSNIILLRTVPVHAKPIFAGHRIQQPGDSAFRHFKSSHSFLSVINIKMQKNVYKSGTITGDKNNHLNMLICAVPNNGAEYL